MPCHLSLCLAIYPNPSVCIVRDSSLQDSLRACIPIAGELTHPVCDLYALIILLSPSFTTTKSLNGHFIPIEYGIWSPGKEGGGEGGKRIYIVIM